VSCPQTRRVSPFRAPPPPVVAPLEVRAFLHAPYETAAEAGGAGNETGGRREQRNKTGNNENEGTRKKKSETERARAGQAGDGAGRSGQTHSKTKTNIPQTK
jgi:hypothetical protein